MPLNWGAPTPSRIYACMYIHSHKQNLFLPDTGPVARRPQPSFHSETDLRIAAFPSLGDLLIQRRLHVSN
jgi:hypothetical protein